MTTPPPSTSVLHNPRKTHMSRFTRLLAGAASAALVMGLAAPTLGHADETTPVSTNYAGPCQNNEGVTVVVDYQELTGNPEVRCVTGDPETGVEATENAGFPITGTAQFGKAFVCRIANRPAADESIPRSSNPDYTEACVRTPPADAYWSYWHSSDQGQTWEYSNLGAGGYDPEPGEWEGWSFSLNATASTNPEPRTDLALAPYQGTNAESTAAAADWIAGQWDPTKTQFSAGLADSIMALGAAKAHPEIITEMLTAITTSDTEYFSAGADSLAKMLIALDIAGQDTNHFLGCERDLTAELDAYVAENARSLNNYWGPHLVTIALNRLGKEVPQNVWDLLIARQQADGGFKGFGSSSPDDTAMGLMALVGVSGNELNPQAIRDDADLRIDRAVAWANDPANRKTKDGTYFWATFSAANSTGLLAGALAEAGEDISSPQAFMRAQQKLTGVGAWQSVMDRTPPNYMATTQGILSVAGSSLGTASLEVDRVSAACGAPTFVTQPVSVTAAVGENATFTVDTDSNPEATYSWELGIGGTWTTVNGAKEATLAFTNLTTAKNGVKIRAVATNSFGAVTSNEATLTVTPLATTPPATTPPATTPPAATYPEAIYTTPGYHNVNGRKWFTSCEPYSVTQRCRTLIHAWTTTEVNGSFVTKQGWAFNNLTYLPSPKSAWAGNRLAVNGTWTADDGRAWRTECGTPQTGRDGCRSWAEARVIDNIAKPGQPVRYGWVTKEIFNNIVKFS